MSSNSYDKNTGLLNIIAGIPRTLINNIQAKADASINNQAKDIEPGNTATSAHSKGDYIVYGSSKKFAEVLSNISIGDALSNATGGNIKDITQGEVLTALNSDLTEVSSDLADKQNISSALKCQVARSFDAGNINANGDLIFNVTGISADGNDIAYIVNTLFDYIIGTARRVDNNTVRVTLHNFYSQAQNVNYCSVIRLYR